MKYYIISIQNDKNEIQYVGKGEYSYYSLTRHSGNAVRFGSVDVAKLALKSEDFTKRNNYSDGSSSPPSILWDGLGICNSKPKADGFINIIEVTEQEIFVKHIQDELFEANK